MVCSITFRPRIEEFEKYADEFVDFFKSKYAKDKFVISPESAGHTVPNHFQIYLDTSSRPDSVKRAILTYIKKLDIEKPQIALKVKTVRSNEDGVLGYVLKEHKDLEQVFINNLDPNYLLECRDSYLRLSIARKMEVDKIRITERNFYPIFTQYYTSNEEELKQSYIKIHDAEAPTFETKSFLKFVLQKMVVEGYYCFNLLTNKKKVSEILDTLIELHVIFK